jgi:hypothetical protein
MFMILVGRHVNGARREWEPAADVGGIELDNEGDEGALGGDARKGENNDAKWQSKSKGMLRLAWSGYLRHSLDCLDYIIKLLQGST